MVIINERSVQNIDKSDMIIQESVTLYFPWSLDNHIFFLFIKEKRQQLLNEIRTLCEASCYQGLVEFQGAFYSPGSGQISIALEYMDGGSLADVLRLQKSIPENVLAHIVQMLLKVKDLLNLLIFLIVNT